VLGAANVLDVDAVKQHAQLRSIERDARGALPDARETEPIALESFLINDKAALHRPLTAMAALSAACPMRRPNPFKDLNGAFSNVLRFWTDCDGLTERGDAYII
jgi:hypothetical protein